jgi:hypothetical protein
MPSQPCTLTTRPQLVLRRARGGARSAAARAAEAGLRRAAHRSRGGGGGGQHACAPAGHHHAHLESPRKACSIQRTGALDPSKTDAVLGILSLSEKYTMSSSMGTSSSQGTGFSIVCHQAP